MRAELSFGYVYLFYKRPCFRNCGTLTEYPRDKLKLRNVVFAVYIITVKGIANKVKACHGKTFFIGGVIEKRIILSNMSSAYYRIMGSYPAHINKVKGKVSWHYDYFLAVGAFIVKSSSKIKIVSFISCSSTHFVTSN